MFQYSPIVFLVHSFVLEVYTSVNVKTRSEFPFNDITYKLILCNHLFWTPTKLYVSELQHQRSEKTLLLFTSETTYARQSSEKEAYKHQKCYAMQMPVNGCNFLGKLLESSIQQFHKQILLLSGLYMVLLYKTTSKDKTLYAFNRLHQSLGS